MKHLFRCFLLMTVLATPLLSGCQKDEPATPTTGNLSSTVSPVGSIIKVTAQNSTGLSFSATPDAATGAFSFSGLVAGQYTLSFTMASGYKPMASVSTSVVAGQNTALGTVQATSDGIVKSGTMSWTTGGQTYTATITAGTINRQVGQSGTLYIKGRSVNGNQTDEVSLRRNNGFSGVGSYTLSLAEYWRTTVGASEVYRDRTTDNPLVITQYDETTGTMAGTFSFWGWTGDLGGNTIIVTNGTFSLRF
ncbi:carboxypeptidase-like regulatory domain-containing protein [Hymenobacter bucti]|uniref:Carboxypeptidase-like regulatory domain-containing protein n=1 Tax=Hymenobacter bucti TaxID=1844114 RepID=A0ABW4QTY0_9BACT